jgi:hypothetical protein
MTPEATPALAWSTAPMPAADTAGIVSAMPMPETMYAGQISLYELWTVSRDSCSSPAVIISMPTVIWYRGCTLPLSLPAIGATKITIIVIGSDRTPASSAE